MSTSTSIDRGDYVEVREGEPTWQNPTVWSSVRLDWKQGTGPANDAANRQQVGADVAVIRAVVDTTANGAAMDAALAAIVAKTNAQVSAADTKELARQAQDLRVAVRRLARQLAALSRVVAGDTSSSDTGTP